MAIWWARVPARMRMWAGTELAGGERQDDPVFFEPVDKGMAGVP